MHNMGKTIGELHALLIEYENGLPKKAAQVLVIQCGRIQKPNKKPQAAKGKGKGREKGMDKLVYKHRTKDDACHHCKEWGAVELEEIKDEDTSPSENTNENLVEAEGFEPPQEDVATVCRSLDAMNAEMQSMKDNQLWRLVDLLPNGKTVGSKWLFKKKTDMDGNAHTYKARLVVKGYTQTYEIDYEETFSPVTDIRPISILIALAAFYGYEIWQMDVKIAFLNGYLDEDIYMVQPEGFIDPKYPRKDPGEPHWTAVKNILKYLRNTKNMFLVYGGNPEVEHRVTCNYDAGFETDKDDIKSQTGYVFVLNKGAAVDCLHPDLGLTTTNNQRRRWQKKMHFLFFSMSVLYMLTTPIPKDGGDDATVEQIRKRVKMLNLPKNYEIHWRPNIWLRMHQESLKVQDSDKPKGNNVAGPLVVNMVEHNNSSRYNDNKVKHKHHDNTRVDPNKKAKPTCCKCGKTGHIKNDCEAYFVHDDDVAWWVDSGATVHVCKDRCWFKTYESLNDGSILHMGNESTALVHVIVSNNFVLSKLGVFIGFGYLSNQMFRLNIVNDNIALAFMSTSKLNDSILWHARLGHVHFKRMQDMFKDRLIPTFDMDTEKFLINSIIESRDAIFDENRFSSVPRPSQMSLKDGNKDIGGSVVSKDSIEEVVQQPEPELRKGKKNMTPKNFGPEFQLYLIEGTKDKVFDQHSYCFNV
ncbi:zinc finger, CCHC-type containing protein [Tanacetum coccineum]